MNHAPDGRSYTAQLCDTVTFVERDYRGVSVPVPDPKLLAIHCALAHVLHASGKAEYLETMDDRRKGMTGVLSDNDSVAALTAFLKLARLEVAVH